MHQHDVDRWTLIKDTVVFQLKLAMDAVRDFLLSPVSIICTIVDIVKGNNKQDSYFYQLMNFGHKTDLWLNLFDRRKAAIVKTDTTISEMQTEVEEENIDALFNQVESLIKDQHAKGGITASAKSSIDKYLNKLSNKP